MKSLVRKGISPSIWLIWKPMRHLKEETIFLLLITDLSMLYWSTLNIAELKLLIMKLNWNNDVIKQNYKSSLIQTQVARKCFVFWSLKVWFFMVSIVNLLIITVFVWIFRWAVGCPQRIPYKIYLIQAFFEALLLIPFSILRTLNLSTSVYRTINRSLISVNSKTEASSRPSKLRSQREAIISMTLSSKNVCGIFVFIPNSSVKYSGWCGFWKIKS